MRKLISVSSFLSFIIFISLQTSITSCTKDITIYDTVTLTQTDTLTRIDTLTQIDTLIITDTAISLELLTANSWKMQEFRGVIGNTITYYLRGGSGNTENYDNEYITFNANKTGILYDAEGTTHQITWDFSNSNNTGLTFVVQNSYPVPNQTVVYENLRYKNKSLLFDQYWTYNNINSHTQAVRIPK